MGVQETRSTSTGVTDELSAIWPQVRTRLLAYLRGRGLTCANADDVVQDVAERVLRHRIAFADADDLLRWCVPVARNASIDQFRRVGRTVPVAVMPERAREDDIADTVSARLRLRRVVDGLGLLSPPERQALAEAMEESGTIADSATRVRRHRARKRLLEIAGPPAVVVAGLRVLRRVWRPGIATAIPAAVAASFVVLAGSAAPALQAAVSTQPAVADSATHRVIDRTTVPAPSRASKAQPAAPSTGQQPSGAGQLRVQSPDPGHKVTVYGHDRRPQDQGTVCIDRLPVVVSVCIGPK